MWFDGMWGWGAVAMVLLMVGFWLVVVWLLVAAHRTSTWDALHGSRLLGGSHQR